MSPEPRPPGRRSPLSRSRILQAAVALADESGLADLSMRKLAQSLGYEAMSLYKHVRDKDDLVAGMVDLVMSEIELPPAGLRWDRAVRACAVAAHDTLLRHPWACELALAPGSTPPDPSGARLRYIEWLLGALHQAGFSDELVYQGYHAIDGHIFGYTMWELGHVTGASDLRSLAADLMTELRDADLPHLARHVRAHLGERPVATSGFEFGLDLILDGLGRSLKRPRRR